MPDVSLAAALLLGFLLGMRHALDADHVAAVAVLASARDGLRQALSTGLAWGAGHALMIGAVGGALVVLRVSVPDPLARLFEMLVAVTLIGLGAAALRGALRARLHRHRHEHDGVVHEHLHFHPAPHRHDRPAPHRHPHPVRQALRPFLVGGLHGLAGSGALAVLVLSTIPTMLLGLLVLGIFSLGSVAGMGLMSLALGAPLAAAGRYAIRLHLALRAAAGMISLGLGLTLAWRIGLG